MGLPGSQSVGSALSVSPTESVKTDAGSFMSQTKFPFWEIQRYASFSFVIQKVDESPMGTLV